MEVETIALSWQLCTTLWDTPPPDKSVCSNPPRGARRAWPGRAQCACLAHRVPRGVCSKYCCVWRCG
eukprot:375933-Prymnesium_polylepis.2